MRPFPVTILLFFFILIARVTVGMELPVRKFLGSHGLASREIIAICDDPNRGLWIGTSSGLNLMNADRIIGFSSSDGLPNSTIGSLCLDADSSLWIGTDGGIAIRDSSGFHTVADGTSLAGFDFRRLIPLRDGTVLACTPTRIFRCSRQSAIELELNPPLDLDDQLIVAAAYTDSTLLIGTAESGLSRIDIRSGERRIIPSIPGRSPEIYAICTDTPYGIVVLSGGSLALYDDKSDSLKPFQSDEQIDERLFDLTVSSDGTIWAISATHLWRLTRKDAIGYTVPVHPFTMTLIRTDHEGSIWIGTSGDGLLQFYSVDFENLSHATLISPLSFYFEPGESVYIPTDRNVLLHDRSNGTTYEIMPADTALHPGEIWDMIRVRNTLLIVGQEGLFEIDTANRIIKPQKVYTIPERFMICIETVDDDLIIGTASGVIRCGKRGWSTIPGIPATTVYYLEKGKDNTLFACTSGLGLWVMEDDEFVKHPVSDLLPSLGINSIVAESDGDGIWIGTEEGLHYYNPTGVFRSWYEHDGLCNNMVTGLVLDRYGRLWIGTDKGIQLFFPDRNEFGPVYDSRIGLIGDEITTGRALALDNSGGLWCGFFGGVSRLQISSIKGFVEGPATTILAIRYGDQLVIPHEHLPYGSHALRIEFRERSLRWPEQMVFRYRLSHVDDDWVITRRHDEIRYRFLPSGTHYFEISARHQLSEWGPVARYAVSVQKPFWETVPFMVAVALISVSMVWGIVTLRTYRLKKRQTELEELVSIRTGQLEEALDTVRELSLTDELTGLPNRRALKEQLGGIVERARRVKAPVSLMVIDIDRFKSLNDNWGHVSGDAALKHMADTMRLESRKSDVICRWGGDEFIYVLHGTDRDDARIYAERLRSKIDHSVFHDGEGNDISYTVSIGVANIMPEDVGEWEDLISRADRAMYEAKNLGKNRVVVDE